MRLLYIRSKIVTFTYTAIMNYTTAEGKHRGSKLYFHEGYTYMSYRAKETKVYLRCVNNRKCNCRGRAELSGSTITRVAAHNHELQQDEGEEKRFIKDLKDAVANEPDIKLSETYQRVAEKYPEKISEKYPFKRLRVTLQRARNRRPARCGICFESMVERWAFIPCGHFPFCETCSATIDGDNDDIFFRVIVCPICRRPLESRQRLFDVNV